MVNWWFGARWFGIRIGAHPLSFSGIPGIHTTVPQTNNWPLSWKKAEKEKHLQLQDGPNNQLEMGL